MRVCFIEDTDLRGGTQIWVAEAIRDFRAAGVDVTVLTSATGFNAEDAKKTDARVVGYDWNAVVRQDEQARKIWTGALADADVAVCTVHPPREGFHCSVFAADCIADAGLRTVLVPKTGTIVPSYEKRFYQPERDIAYDVVAITGFTRDYLVSDYRVPADHVHLVYQGTELDRFRSDPARKAEARRRYPLPEGAGPVLGCLGSFEERKAQALLLDAVDRVRRNLPDVHLMLVGEGPDEELLKRTVAERDLARNVSFFGFTNEPEYPFELIDVTVLASVRKEGLPNVLLESMAMGTPVVSTRLAGTPEVVHEGETGLLVEPGDVGALAGAIERIWSDRAALQRMGAAGRALMEKDFDKIRQFGRFREHFQTLVD
ncbi:MAG: glycosyltransferase family 4 protein [Planctomycetota bacterium]|jgi:glycosyltransferase involved in cell wall biosynthesis